MQKLTHPHWPEIWFKPTWMGCAALILDSSWRVLPCLKIGVNCRCRGLDRRGRMLIFVVVILSKDPIELNLALLQNYHLLHGCIALSLRV